MPSFLRSVGRFLHRCWWALLDGCVVMGPIVPPLPLPYHGRQRTDRKPDGPRPKSAPVDGPPDGHPERLVPEQSMSEQERRLWAQLVKPGRLPRGQIPGP